jgi:hypothetical protein
MLKRLNLARGETIEVKIRGLNIPMVLKRSARARRFSLQVSEARRGAVLTMPCYSSFADADEFLSRHLGWLKERVAGLSEPVPFTHGAIVPLRGFAHVLRFAGSVRKRGGLARGRSRFSAEIAAAVRGRRRWARSASFARLAEAAGSSRSQDARRGARETPRSHAETDFRARSDHTMGIVLDQRRALLLMAPRARAPFCARLPRCA